MIKSLKSGGYNSKEEVILILNEEEFRSYLKQKKKPDNTISSYIKRVKTFESYLNAKNPPKELDTITREDIEDFAFVWGKEKKIHTYLYLWGVQYYYLFKGVLNLHKTADEIKEWVQLEKYKLVNFEDINKEYVKMLRSIGIRTAKEMLEQGRTPTERTKLATQSGVPLDYILELVKLSNLARIGGLKKKRARLFYDAGLDTLDKIANLNVKDLIEKISEFVRKIDFKGRTCSLSEAEHAISMAKFLNRIVEY
ncbi:MAG: DUF4332 domain-containing protein [Candidatus Hodarchaeota archaeon]